MGGYTLRRVNDMGSLMEKVLIAEAGLDDVVLEMCKYVTKLEMLQKSVGAEQKEEFLAATFHFYRSEGEDDARILTFMYGLGGQMLGVNIGSLGSRATMRVTGPVRVTSRSNMSVTVMDSAIAVVMLTAISRARNRETIFLDIVVPPHF